MTTPVSNLGPAIPVTPAAAPSAQPAPSAMPALVLPELVAASLPSLQPALAAGTNLAGAMLAKPSTGAFQLIPGRVPDAIGIDQVLAAMPQADREQAIKLILSKVETELGLRVPPALRQAILANPARLADSLRATPAQISQGLAALQGLMKSGALGEGKPEARILPASFDLAKADAVVWSRPTPELKPLAPGLFQGDAPGALSDAQAKANVIAAEIFDRLASNTHTKGTRFSVRYGGKRFTRVDTFVEALRRDGHEITARVNHRVANFANLKTQVGEQLLDVPLGLLVATGIKDAEGREAFVPTVHSEIVFSIRRTAATQGPGLDADLKFYQGVPHTGFFAADLVASPTWCGKTTSAVFEGADAVKALRYGGLLTSLIEESARAQGLGMAGYGITGVCNDSVAIVQHAVSGATTAHPLLMLDESLLPFLDVRLAGKNHRDRAGYQALRASLLAVPNDLEPSASTLARTRGSFPWAPGQEPIKVGAEARAILFG